MMEIENQHLPKTTLIKVQEYHQNTLKLMSKSMIRNNIYTVESAHQTQPKPK